MWRLLLHFQLGNYLCVCVCEAVRKTLLSVKTDDVFWCFSLVAKRRWPVSASNGRSCCSFSVEPVEASWKGSQVAPKLRLGVTICKHCRR